MSWNSKNVTPEVQYKMASLLAALAVMADEDPAGIDRVSRLFVGEPRETFLARGMLSMLPPVVDVEQWNAWLEGAGSPLPPFVLADPDRGRKPGARGAQQSAAARRDEAARRAADLREKLAEAEGNLEACEASLATANAQLRVTVFAQTIADASRIFAGPFALGPLWTLMRSTSAYLQQDVLYENSLDSVERGRYDEHRERRGSTAAETLQLLDVFCGDVALEIELHEAILAVLRRHYEPIAVELAGRNLAGQKLSERAKRAKRSADDRRNSVRPGTRVSNRSDVLNGLKTGFDDQSDDAAS